MLEKPFVLSLILTIISWTFEPLTSRLLPPESQVQFLLCVVIPALYIGISHVSKYKERFTIEYRAKIALYYSIINLVFVLTIVLLMTANTSLKGVPLYNRFHLIMIFDISFQYLTSAFFIYLALGVGCNLRLKFIKNEITEVQQEQKSNIFQKPFILSLILLIICYSINMVFPLALKYQEDPYSPIKVSVAAFLAAVLIGISYANNYKTKLPVIDRIKIALYSFIMFTVYIAALILMLKGKIIIHGLTFFDPPQKLKSLQVLLINFIAAFLGYMGLTAGSSFRLKFEKNNLLESQIKSQK